MQRRAAALYFAFFLVVGLGAYGFMNVAQAQQPQYALDGTSFENGSTHTIGGTEYTLTEIGAAGGGGGHGGGGGEVTATLAWTNESVTSTGTLENGSSTTYRNESWTVAIANESGVSSFTLVHEQNVSAILRNDSAVENAVATQNGTDYVVYRENQTLVPLAEYLPEPETREFGEGDQYPYDGNDATVANVSRQAVTFEWTTSEERTRELSEGGNVTLANGQQYFAHFPTSHEVEVVPIGQFEDYSQTSDRRDYFTERMNGLWGILLISFSAAIMVAAAAYLPTRG